MRTLKWATALLCIGLGTQAHAAIYQRLDTELSVEARAFPQERRFSEQSNFGLSLALGSEWYGEWAKGQHSVTVLPFVRYDSLDQQRSHFDLRELNWQGLFGALEVRAGLSRVFWGKTELLHLVDIINQDDALENIDGEDKLGQPLLRLSWTGAIGNLQAYALPYFRERRFAGHEGRLRAPLPIDPDRVRYESADEDKHLGYALRLQSYVGAFDFGLAWFSGTQRAPQLIPIDFVDTPQGPQPTALAPFYGLMDQASLDAQYTVGAWLLKLESVWREQALLQVAPEQPARIEPLRYAAATAGFEFTQYGLFDSSVDAGWLVEYLWDERGTDTDASFQNDLFLATRLAANDVNDSTLLGGLVIDLDHGSRFISLEAGRRLTGQSKLSLEARLFNSISARDANFYAIRQDDYLQLEYFYYF